MFYFYKNMNGGPTEMSEREAYGSITQGDAVKYSANTSAPAVETVGAHDDSVVGVATHDASSGDDVAFVKAKQGTLFGAEASTDWDASTLGYEVKVDYDTDGQTVVAGASTGNDAFMVLGIVDNTDNEEVFGYFLNTPYNANS